MVVSAAIFICRMMILINWKIKESNYMQRKYEDYPVSLIFIN